MPENGDGNKINVGQRALSFGKCARSASQSGEEIRGTAERRTEAIPDYRARTSATTRACKSSLYSPIENLLI